MIRLLSKVFIKNSKELNDNTVRTAYGTLCSIVGIILNVLLFAGKLLAGTLTGSIAITADSFNNLGDAASSIITLLGFRLADKKADPEHPFGHGRIEYISALIVSFAIILMGFELCKSSVSAIIKPQDVSYSVLSLVILGVSVLFKVYMAYYNNRVGQQISSASMIATSKDSFSDAISTFVVLIVALISPYLPFRVDAWAGLGVSLLIIWTGINSVRETVSPLLGQSPDIDFVEDIEKIVMSHSEICGIHDLIVHDYGPGRVMISLHAEVPYSMDIDVAHDVIDNVEVELSDKLNCYATIHMDPVNTTDPKTVKFRETVSYIVAGIIPNATIHDFRMVYGKTHTNLIFDAVLPHDSDMSEKEFSDEIIKRVSYFNPKFNCVVKIDRDYVGK